MIFFPDVNVWIALVVAEHAHAAQARLWAEHAKNDELALSRVTQMGLLRLLTNSHVMGADALSARDAWKVFDRITNERNIFFAAEPVGIDSIWRELTPPSQSGANLWTDAYLAAFAKATGYTLVTFDRGFGSYKNVPVRVLSSG
jgi:uncharacterized protein